MSNRFKSGDCYIARLPSGESPVRLVEKTEQGHWKTRSLKHGRVVIVKNESLFLRPCTENDLISCAVTVRPNRRSKKERIFAPLATKSSRDATSRKTKPKPTKMPPYSMTALDAACRILKEAKTALTCQEIVERAKKRKYWQSTGETPHFTLHTAIIREIKRLGENARFIKVGRGLFTVK